MKHIVPSFIAATVLAIPAGLAQVPQTLNYQGRVTVQGTNFNGTGQFKFALVDAGINLNQTATGSAMIAGGEVTSISIIIPGSGYTTPPEVTITNGAGSSGTGATAEASIGAGGAVTGITVTNPGSGYTVAIVTIPPPPPNIQVFSTWSNDQTSMSGSEPTAAVTLPVVNGLYSVQLGDTAAGMEVINPGVFHGPRYLRVWFSDGTNGFQQLTPDQPLATAPYAFHAIQADSLINPITSEQLADGAITSGKIAAGAVGSTHLASGAIGVTNVNAGAAPLTGQVLGFNGTDFQWTTPGGSGWGLDGNAAASGKFLGTTDSIDLEFRTNNTAAFSLRASDQNLVFPQIPSNLSDFRATSSGLGIYGTNPGFFGSTLGRTFAGLDIDGPVLYGEGSTGGGALGVTYKTGGTPPFYFDATLVEEPVLTWQAETANGSTVHIGSRTANGDPKLIRFGDGEYVHIGENGADDTLELKGRNISAICTNGFMTVNSTDLFLGHASRRGAPGRALVDWRDPGTNKSQCFINFGDDWEETRIGGALTIVNALRITGGADLAEPFAMSHENVEPGSVVIIDEENPGKLRMSHAAYDKKVAGIVSGADGIHPGISMIQENMLEAGENVALSGRVYVKANNSAGEIAPGDLLTTSAIPGEAMKASDHDRAQGAILGKAMTKLSDQSGKVLVLVTLQ